MVLEYQLIFNFHKKNTRALYNKINTFIMFYISKKKLSVKVLLSKLPKKMSFLLKEIADTKRN
jgi:hypothetical protein